LKKKIDDVLIDELMVNCLMMMLDCRHMPEVHVGDTYACTAETSGMNSDK
jgi:hypothetical protein